MAQPAGVTPNPILLNSDAKLHLCFLQNASREHTVSAATQSAPTVPAEATTIRSGRRSAWRVLPGKPRPQATAPQRARIARQENIQISGQDASVLLAYSPPVA